MNIVCAIAASDAKPHSPDVLVLPEGVPLAALREASVQFPGAVVVSACPAGQRMRAYVQVGQTNKIQYLKVLSDGRSIGTGKKPAVLPVYQTDELALGVVICRDIEDVGFLHAVLGRLRASPQRVKLLCIPADMQDHWFSSDRICGFEGVYLALSNNNSTYPEGRALSFIAAPDATRLVRQLRYEPIVAEA